LLIIIDMSRFRVEQLGEEASEHDEEELSKEICDINYKLSNPSRCARGICSYTTKHAYRRLKSEL